MSTKEEKKTTIELTEKQKEKVVELFAKEEAPKTYTFVDLMFQHEINNVKYGPGNTSVPSDMAGTLTSADNKALTFRLKENQSSNTMIEIMGKGISRIVSRNVTNG